MLWMKQIGKHSIVKRTTSTLKRSLLSFGFVYTRPSTFCPSLLHSKRFSSILKIICLWTHGSRLWVCCCYTPTTNTARSKPLLGLRASQLLSVHTFKNKQKNLFCMRRNHQFPQCYFSSAPHSALIDCTPVLFVAMATRHPFGVRVTLAWWNPPSLGLNWISFALVCRGVVKWSRLVTHAGFRPK